MKFSLFVVFVLLFSGQVFARSENGCDIRMWHFNSMDPYQYVVYIGTQPTFSSLNIEGAITNASNALSIGQCEKLNDGPCSIESDDRYVYVKRGQQYLIHYTSTESSTTYATELIRRFTSLGICENKLTPP